MGKITINYATGSDFKKEEISQILKSTHFRPRDVDVLADDLFCFNFENVITDEPLERKLEAMVCHKAKSAYRQLMAPCIVEHAGLILSGYNRANYPGGLTQPMWDALGAGGFVNSVRWAGGAVIARAVIGYCDGLTVKTFTGETGGILAPTARGSREFYWDTIFCPEGGNGLTYAEISDKPDGLQEKVKLSQSSKAMKSCLEYIASHRPMLFPSME